MPERPDELGENGELNREDGILFVGDKGKMLVTGLGAGSIRVCCRKAGTRNTSVRRKVCRARLGITRNGFGPAKPVPPRARISISRER